MTSTRDKIIEVTELLIRTRGYQGFAFREVASLVGIKSASVHYHFPTKADLVNEVMVNYLQRFELALAQANALARIDDRMAYYVTMYRNELAEHQSGSVCLMLSNDVAVIPNEVAQLLKRFVSINEQWLADVVALAQPQLSVEQAFKQGRSVFTAFSGALTHARAMGDMEFFEQVAHVCVEHLVFGRHSASLSNVRP